MKSKQAKPITDIDTLRSYLHTAMKLEHATIPPYLTALYSIKPGTNPDAAQVLRVVAVEEMLHLVLAANLLNAIGGTPRVTADDFVPCYPAFLPDGETDFRVGLQPFSRDAIDTFLKIERPRLAPEPDMQLLYRPEVTAESRHYITCHPTQTDFVFYSIGEFYDAVKKGFSNVYAQMGEKMFCGDPRRQVTSEYYYSGGGSLTPVTDLKSAETAIDLIIEQGEGELKSIYGDQGELAHYYRYMQLKCGRYFQKSDDTGRPPFTPTGPALDVDWDAVYPLKANAKMTDYEPGSEAEAAAKAFNDAYRGFLHLLQRAFTGEPQLLEGGVSMMFELRNAMNRLIRNPLSESSPFNAAPTFEVCPHGRSQGQSPCEPDAEPHVEEPA
ncbi:ferritin-like domain-containing protein [Methylobacterium sp. SyP6R]|uniref:ferritin-like domain-containing protein n=1 Tax=Methylobacterium sp. SyP6R TaxID=2718876 RepID=UPI001F25151A|nr:ferritin-like protein [Methylobacterium sp. SyP6R]MCF4129508.1 ferritin-like protein [Methylobacterium sp. SyP6R]